MVSANIILQARMGSHRLPGKSMMPLWKDFSLFELVLSRITRSKRADKVILATTINPEDDVLVRIAERYTVPIFRGSEDDVLGRYYEAFLKYPSDAVVRACADNPLLDPWMIDSLIDFFWSHPCDYASNLGPISGYPDGVGVEMVSRDTLARLHHQATSPSDREHVVTFLHNNPEYTSRVMASPPDCFRPQYRLDIDFPEDFSCLKEFIARLPAGSAPLWTTMEIISVLDADPSVLEIRKKRD